MRTVLVIVLVAVLAVSCKKREPDGAVDPQARAGQITVHRVGGGCVAVIRGYNEYAMAAIPCPPAEAAKAP